MKQINISNNAGRDAVVSLNTVAVSKTVRWLDEKKRPASSVQLVKEPVDRSIGALESQFGSVEKAGQAMIDGDPEIDAELTGMILRDTSRVYLSPDRTIARRISVWEVVLDAKGQERDRRVRVVNESNVATEIPLKWSGKFLDKVDAMRRFVIAGKRQLIHVNGLTYDFLYGMAKELESKKKLMLLGGGPKGIDPLVLQRGGTPYRALLEGRTDGDRYCLLAHFTNLELKQIPKEETP